MTGIAHPENFPHGKLAPITRQCEPCHLGNCDDCTGWMNPGTNSEACPCHVYMDKNPGMGLDISPEGKLSWVAP